MKFDIACLTLEEKLHLLCGKDWWCLENANGKLPDFRVGDGPSGLRKEIDGTWVSATLMPTLSVVSNTWSREMAFLDGETIANDCVENDVDVLLAPGVNIKRSPLCGRNFEYFSEDPYLAGTLAKEFINGVQKSGIGTSLKHFCLNNSETDRTHTSSEVDERVMREIYTRAFEIALEAKPWTVMCSYNKVNGVYSAENKWLLKDILRDKLHFDGLIVSDWRAVGIFYKAIKASLNLIMPHENDSFDNLLNAYNKGLLTDDEVDYSVQKILDLMEKAVSAVKTIKYTKKERHDNAVKIAEEGIVLLKNDNLLPIIKGTCLVNHPENPLINGGGSASVKTDFKMPDIIELLNKQAKSGAVFEKASHRNCEFILRAHDCDTVIITVNGEIEQETMDRETIKLSNLEEERILQLASANKNVVVVVIGGSAVDMSAWIDSVKAVVFCGYAGEGLNEALANIITGKTCPSGKLSESFPMCIEDTFMKLNHGNGFVNWYNDGVFVGYRYYDKYNLDVLFPFGYGLSYAKFSYTNLKIKKLGDTDFAISYDITNESDFDAKEVSEIYVKDVFASVIRPEKELKAFSKDLIKAHQTKTICCKLDKMAFAYYSIPSKDWYVENGEFIIMVGSSSRDIRLRDTVSINLDESIQYSKVSKY